MGGGNLISPFFYTSEVGYFRFKKKTISQQLDSIKPLHGKKKKTRKGFIWSLYCSKQEQ